MTEISNLINIAENIGMNQAASALREIDNKQKQPEASIIMPFVGEFSSGKTSLINALTDSKKLETSAKPTTATIFEIHFGQPKCDAEVFDVNGNTTHVEDIADLKNATLAETPFVLVNDTSDKISSSTIIVDTPGLSSPDPKHKETLVKFIPKADGVILVVDVNQSITKSLTDFVKTIRMSCRPIFLAITKCDTKSPEEVERLKKYIAENCEIEINQVACVSAKNNDLEQLYGLFKSISNAKSSILEKVNAQRVKNIAESMIERINELLGASSDDKKLNLSIKEQEQDLRKLNSKISNLIGDSQAEIEELGRKAVRDFEGDITPKLDSIAKSSNQNFDQEAVAAINTTSIMVLNQFKQSISQTLRERASSKRNTEDSINLQSLQTIDMSTFKISGLSYTLSLNEMGHEYDGYIAKGLKVAAVAAVVVATAGVGAGAAGAAAGAEAAGAAAAVEGAAVASETIGVMDVVSVATDAYILNKILPDAKEKETEAVRVQNQPLKVEERGIVDGIVGWVTDKTMGKPQRMRAIRNYLDSTLIPSFKNEMNRIQTELISLISSTLQREAAQTVAERTQELQKLKEIKEKHEAEFNARKNELMSMKTTLSNL